MDPQFPRKQDQHLNSEIDPVMCVAFVLFVFLIVPFTLLSPFQYPQTSALDKLLSVNTQYASRSSETRLSGYRVIDLSATATADTQATGSVTR
jgi:hypothetical protein